MPNLSFSRSWENFLLILKPCTPQNLHPATPVQTVSQLNWHIAANVNNQQKIPQLSIHACHGSFHHSKLAAKNYDLNFTSNPRQIEHILLSDNSGLTQTSILWHMYSNGFTCKATAKLLPILISYQSLFFIECWFYK